MPSGLYVVGSRSGSERNLMTLNWATQVAQEPKLVGISVEHHALTHRLVSSGGVFSLSLLDRGDRSLVRDFVKPVADIEIDESTGEGTMNGYGVVVASTGAPILALATAWLDCEVRHSLPLGSHTWFVGEVVDAGAGSTRDDPGVLGGSYPWLRMEDTRMHYGG